MSFMIMEYTSTLQRLDFDLLKKELSDTHIILVKLHYLVKDSADWSNYDGFIYKCDQSWDIQELYLISDILVTDYSSVMFDYSILKRPMIIYAYDYEKYRDNLRGFYFNIFEEFPGPVVENTPDLIDSIKNYDIKEYKKKYKKFLDKFTSFDDGNASSRIVDLIFRKIRIISTKSKEIRHNEWK